MDIDLWEVRNFGNDFIIILFEVKYYIIFYLHIFILFINILNILDNLYYINMDSFIFFGIIISIDSFLFFLLFISIKNIIYLIFLINEY